MSEKSNEATYPGVHLTFPIATASYDVALRRLDAMDGRLQTIIAFIVATSAAVPSLAVGRGIHFRSYYFYGALTCFILAVIIGTVARLAGRIKVIRPRHAFDHWLHKPDWEFKMDFINQAAIDFDRNSTLVNRKWWSTVAVTLLFCVQAACLAAWVVLDHSP